MSPTVIIVPGVNNSGPGHWQSLWEASHAGYRRVEQNDWDLPYCDEWVAGLDRSVASALSEVVFVAHSLGCLTVVHWAQGGAVGDRGVKGALLVAPVDLEAPAYPPGVGGFTPIPMGPLPFPSIVVASSNDPFVSIERAEAFARAWGSRFEKIGACGHINAEAGFGPWPEGETLLSDLLGS